MPETIGTAYVQIEPSFEGVTPKIEQAMGGEGKKGGEAFGTGFASVLGTSAKVIGGAVAAGTAAVAGFVKSATESFGEYEQLVGGVETLFGNQYNSVEEYAAGVGLSLDEAGQTWEFYQQRQQQVLDNAANAYKTAGMDANTYMETVTSFAAALNSSLGENAWQSANYADMAIQDMADNANKMGTSMEAVQNAYMGFSKGNFTMLDNLKLGYGGTKTEMERLMRDAEQMEGLIEGSLSIENFSDVVDAIHIVQENLRITGTTANEASTTIQGSLSMLKASWENVITGMGDKNSDMSALIQTLVTNAETFIGNLLPVVEQALVGVSTLIAQLGPVIAEKLPGLLQNVLPMLLNSGVVIIQTLAEGIIDAIPQLMPAITDVLIQLVNMLVQMAPTLIQVGAELLITLATGIAEALPELIPTIIEVILTIVQYLLENIDLLIDAAAQLIIGLAVGLINALPILIEKVPVLITALYKALTGAYDKFWEVGKQLLVKLKDAFVQAWPMMVTAATNLFNQLKEKLLTLGKMFMNVGKNIVEGIKKGIADAWDSMKQWFMGLLDGLVDSVKEFFKIGSPSDLMADEIGYWLPPGVAKGIKKGMGELNLAFDDMMTSIMPAKVDAQTMNTYIPQENTSVGPVVDIDNLLREYLPRIAEGGQTNVVLEGDLGRLFRAIQRESYKNTQLTGQTSLA